MDEKNIYVEFKDTVSPNKLGNSVTIFIFCFSLKLDWKITVLKGFGVLEMLGSRYYKTDMTIRKI